MELSRQSEKPYKNKKCGLLVTKFVLLKFIFQEATACFDILSLHLYIRLTNEIFEKTLQAQTNSATKIEHAQ